MLKGNPIARHDDYRVRIWRMLPNLKNLDVIVTPRAPRTFCREDTLDNNDQDDGNNGNAPTITSDIPRELEGNKGAAETFNLNNLEYLYLTFLA